MAADKSIDDSKPRADVVRNRERMLDAAALTLARNADASLSDIADAAGLSRATAYRHFADVDAIRAALVEEAGQVGRAFLQGHLVPLLEGASGELAPDDILGVLRAALPLRHRWTEVISSEPVHDEGLIQTFSPLAGALLKRGQVGGHYRADLDADVIAEALIALTLYAVRRMHADGVSVERAIDMVRPFVDGLRVPSAAEPIPGG
ncbi:MAG: TetR family transcriptional regulator [Solirubrobacteraceae bacterium]|nr:TetR family transcriptional regulator [Solirubrobacteraceae bacterium]